jgi:Spy/CpxP family protein refolding chaperone
MNIHNTLKSTFTILWLSMLTTSSLVRADTEDYPNSSMQCEHRMKSQGDMSIRQGHMHPAGMEMFGLPPMMLPFPPEIALSEEQQDKLFTITYAEMPKMHEWIKSHHTLMKEMQTAINAPAFDEDKVKTIADQLAMLEKEQWLNRAKVQNKLLNILTPAQRKLLLDRPIQDKEMSQDMHHSSLRVQPEPWNWISS